MKILWIVNTVFPYPAEKMGLKNTVFGGWLNSLAEDIITREDIELAICSMKKGGKIEIFDDGKIKYYIIPEKLPVKYNKRLEKYFKTIKEDFNPDVVHIHGTEYTQGLAYINSCTNKNVVISIQGMTSVCSEVYTANMSIKDILYNITMRDILKGNILKEKKRFLKRGQYEIEILRKTKNVIGRTTWDYANTKAINKNIKYYFCNESLRKDFYNDIWISKNKEKHTIFISQASYPIKGFHYMLKALKILKEKYPNVLLKVAGTNITKNHKLKEKIKFGGYGKIIKKLIKKYNLEENIIFLGIIDSNSMKSEMLKSEVFVLPSSIENSSNSLGEAMLLGMNCIASNVGGTSDMLEHRKEGYLYPYTEYAILAEYISRIFDDDLDSIQYRANARKKALEKHNRIKNSQTIIEIYNEIRRKNE